MEKYSFAQGFIQRRGRAIYRARLKAFVWQEKVLLKCYPIIQRLQRRVWKCLGKFICIYPLTQKSTPRNLHKSYIGQKTWKAIHRAILCNATCNSKWLETTQMLMECGLSEWTMARLHQGTRGSCRQMRTVLKNFKWGQQGGGKTGQRAFKKEDPVCAGTSRSRVSRSDVSKVGQMLQPSERSLCSHTRSLSLPAATTVFRLQHAISLVCF